MTYIQTYPQAFLDLGESQLLTWSCQPLKAIQEEASQIGAVVESVLDDYAYSEIKQKAAGKDVCLVFINSRSSERTNSVEGNYGDRNNLTVILLQVNPQ